MTNAQRQVIIDWIAALRSGIYEQGQGQLCRKEDGRETFCCLGVLCDLMKLPRRKRGYAEQFYMADIDEWLSGGLSDATFDRLTGIPRDSDLYVGDLITLNDSRELTFAQIADILEAYLMQHPVTVEA